MTKIIFIFFTWGKNQSGLQNVRMSQLFLEFDGDQKKPLQPFPQQNKIEANKRIKLIFAFNL